MQHLEANRDVWAFLIATCANVSWPEEWSQYARKLWESDLLYRKVNIVVSAAAAGLFVIAPSAGPLHSLLLPLPSPWGRLIKTNDADDIAIPMEMTSVPSRPLTYSFHETNF